MATDPTGEISELKSKLASVEAVLGPDAMRKEADALRERAGEPGLWADTEQGQAVTRKMLLEQVWGFHFDPRTNIVESHMSRMRAKVELPGAPQLIRTKRGAGYLIGPGPTPAA